MKKLLTFLVVVIFVLALSACSSTNSGNTDNRETSNNVTTQSQTTENTTPSTDNQPTQDTTQNNPKLTADEALDIALKQAGVTKDSIRNLENTLDRENGVLVYEIDFKSGNIEYSYDINAETGEVVERDRDTED